MVAPVASTILLPLVESGKAGSPVAADAVGEASTPTPAAAKVVRITPNTSEITVLR